MTKKRDNRLNAEIDDLLLHMPAWVLAGVANDYEGQLSIECLRAVSKVAAELKASNIIGEIGAGNAGSVEISFKDASGPPAVISISSDGKVSGTGVRKRNL